MVSLVIKKEDEGLAKEIFSLCGEEASYNEISNFDGNMLIQIVLPLATVLAPIFIKYIEDQRVTVKFDGIEITANKKEIHKILEMINKQKSGHEN